MGTELDMVTARPGSHKDVVSHLALCSGYDMEAFSHVAPSPQTLFPCHHTQPKACLPWEGATAQWLRLTLGGHLDTRTLRHRQQQEVPMVTQWGQGGQEGPRSTSVCQV